MENRLFQILKNRVTEKRRKEGDRPLTLVDFEELCNSVLEPPKSACEPGYPKEVYRSVPSITPWVPAAPLPPERRTVASPEEELQARAEGFFSNFNPAPRFPGYPRMIVRPSADPTEPSEHQLVNTPEEEEAVRARWERKEAKAR